MNWTATRGSNGKFPVYGRSQQMERDRKLCHRNESTLNSKQFKDGCSYHKVEATRRQASKWNNGKGLARR